MDSPSEPVAKARRHLRAVTLLTLAVVAVGLVATACGGGGDDSAADSSTGAGNDTSAPTAASSSSTTSTTGVSDEPADADTVALAQAGLFVDDDFTDPWTGSENGSDPGFEACSDVDGGPQADLADGAAPHGHLFKHGEDAFWVSTRTFAFPTPADADAWLAIVDADTWTDCVTDALQAVQDGRDTGVTATLRTRDAEHLGEQGFESYAAYDLTDADGNLVGASDYSFYQRDRLVIRVAQDVGGIEDEPFQQAGDDAYRALQNAYARVEELQDGGGSLGGGG